MGESGKKGIVLAGVGLAATAVLLLAVAGAVGAYLYWTSPRYSLRQVRRALETHDLATFEKYVDIHGLCDSTVDRLVLATANGTEAPSSRGETWRRSLGAGLAMAMKPLLLGQMERAVKKAVLEGTVGRDQKSVRIEDVQREGKTALVWLILPGQALDPPRDEDVRVRLRLSDMGTYWRAVEVVAIEGVSGH